MKTTQIKINKKQGETMKKQNQNKGRKVKRNNHKSLVKILIKNYFNVQQEVFKVRIVRSDKGTKRSCYIGTKGYKNPHIRSEHERVYVMTGKVVRVKETYIRKDLLGEIL